MISRILVLCDRISVAFGALSAGLLAAIAVIILSELVARFAFNYSLSFAWEYSGYCMAAAVFCGASYALRMGTHVRVSLVISSVPPRVAWLIDALATLIGLVAALFITYALSRLAIDSLVSGSRSATTMATPLIIPQGAIALGCALFALQLFTRLVRLLLREPPELQAEDNDFAG